MLHLALKAFAPAPLPFALLHVDTGHNFPEVLDYRDETVERLGRAARRRAACRTTSTTAGCASAPTAPATRCRPCRCSTPSRRQPVRRGLRRRPARRGEGAGQGARSSACATSSASGTRAASGPSCGTSTTAGTRPASTCASSRCRTGPSSTSGSTSSARASRCRPLLRPRARGVRARRHVARRGRVGRPEAGEAVETRHGPLPHGRRHELHRRGRLRRHRRRRA